MTLTSKAHMREVQHSMFSHKYPDGLTSFEDGRCSFCGSLSPSKVAAAIKESARGSWADWKYGWPHKAYFNDVPDIKWAKFYTVHLQDATDEEREIIEKHLGFRFTFSDEGASVSWRQYV